MHVPVNTPRPEIVVGIRDGTLKHPQGEIVLSRNIIHRCSAFEVGVMFL